MRFLTLFCLAASAFASGPFIVNPYLQLGDSPHQSASESLALMWHTADEDAAFAVESKLASATKWSVMAKPAWKRIAVRTIEPHRVWTASIAGLEPGEPFDYRVTKNGVTVFSSHGVARKSATQPFRFAVFGDCGANTEPQRKIARLTMDAKPDFALITGDIVYTRGRISEYRPKFYDIYNNAQLPLLASTLFIGAPGNHDESYPGVIVQYDAIRDSAGHRLRLIVTRPQRDAGHRVVAHFQMQVGGT